MPVLTLAAALVAARITAMETAAAALRDYTMTLVSRQFEDGALGAEQVMAAKWCRPYRVYYRRLSSPHVGREILWSPDANDGKILVSLNTWPNVKLDIDPHGALAMKGTRHPVDRSSLVDLVDLVASNYRRATARGEVQEIDLGPGEVAGRACERLRLAARSEDRRIVIGPGETLWDVAERLDIEVPTLLYANRALGWRTPSDARPGQTIVVPEYDASRVDLCLDLESSLPLSVELYDREGTLVDRFEHRDLRVNVGLSAADFSLN
ncbi:MAG TPA: DUF1571 domain-containing protein [Candidatus Polarisedimenticolaceae bacterium]|nr:DUF1571 domain-containing protein [Candidatus Polarisedimenticolaceae bacterium]